MKILSKKFLSYKEDVYDITVEKYHNFALANGVIVHNCCGHDLQRVLNEGFNGVQNRVASRPPKHLREALYQMANYIGILQAEWAGAQAFSSFDTFLAPYVFADKYLFDLGYNDIKKAIRNFIYNVNVPSRWGQSPFSNVTIDYKVPKDLANQFPKYNDGYLMTTVCKDVQRTLDYHNFIIQVEERLGKELCDEIRSEFSSQEEYERECLESLAYKHFEPEMKLIVRAFYEVLNEGDKDGRPFTFPIPTVNITEDFDWDDENADLIFENAGKYGSSYFQNFIGSQYKRNPETGELESDPHAYRPGDVRSMCPLTLDTLVVAKQGDEVTEITLGKLNPDTDMVLGSDNKWYHFTKTEVYIGKKIVKITVKGDSKDAWITREVKMSVDHLQPVRISSFNGPDVYVTKTADELKVGDILPCGSYKGQICTIIKKEYLDTEPTQCINIIGSKDNLFLLANDILTHNCRLQLDRRQLRKRGGGLFGADAQTGCYDDKTEVLTKNGWKYFKDISFDDEFYTITSDRKIELHKPINIFKYDFDGMMHGFKSDCVDLLVTPNHRMLLTHNSNDKFRFVEAQDCKDTILIPMRAEWAGENKDHYILKATDCSTKNSPKYEDIKVNMDDWLKFLGLFISEGSVRGSKNGSSDNEYKYEVILTQRKSENISIIEDLLKRLPFNYSTTITDNGTYHWTIYNKQLWKELSPLGCSYEKYIPRYIFDLPKEKLQYLFDYMILGDGHVRKDNGHTEYYTSSGQLRDDFQQLCLLLGKGTNNFELLPEDNHKTCIIDGRKITQKHTLYTISVNIAKNRSVREHFTEYYKGNVYCVEVPNNTLFVRRNGKSVWCGNSVGVVTINMARLGYLYKGDKQLLIKKLYHLMDLGKSTLEKKRAFVIEMLNRGLYPYTKRYLKTFDTFFSTIGVNGMNEMVRNFTGDTENLTTEKGRALSSEILDLIRDRLLEYQEATGNLYNLEATPAEGCTYRLASKDLEKYPDIITAGTKQNPYYTNSSQLPVSFTDDAFTALDLQDDLQTKYTGGTVLHLYMNEPILDSKVTKQLVKSVLTNYRLPYISVTPSYSSCPKHGYIPGHHKYCPMCDAELVKKYAK